MDIMTHIRNNLYKESYKGFCLEDEDGYCMIARRINKWQWSVETETAKGNINTYDRVDYAQVEEWASEMIDNSENCAYNPYM